MRRYYECDECGEAIFEGDWCLKQHGTILCEKCGTEQLWFDYSENLTDDDCDLDEGRRSDEPDRYNGYEEDDAN